MIFYVVDLLKTDFLNNHKKDYKPILFDRLVVLFLFRLFFYSLIILHYLLSIGGTDGSPKEATESNFTDILRILLASAAVISLSS